MRTRRYRFKIDVEKSGEVVETITRVRREKDYLNSLFIEASS